MKMKLFAAAVAALAAGGAYAQSSVTLYGIADVGVEYVNKQPGNGDSVFRMTSGNYSASRFGLRGVEDLGGGLKAIFTLENGFNVDTGGQADSSRFFNRLAFVGLQGNFGAVTLGRQNNLIYDFGIQFDPMVLAARYSLGNMDGDLGGGTGRADNAIKYRGTFGGLTASALYSFGWNGNNGVGGEIPGEAKAGREYDLGLTYANGPFAVGAVFNEKRGGTIATSSDKVRKAAVAGSFAFGPAKAFLGYRYGKATGSLSVVSGAAIERSDLYWGGVTYNVTPAFALTGAAYYTKNKNTDNDPWQFVVSGDYALSKRTDAYLNVAYARNKGNNSYGLGGYGTAEAGSNQTGAVVGIRHRF